MPFLCENPVPGAEMSGAWQSAHFVSGFSTEVQKRAFGAAWMISASLFAVSRSAGPLAAPAGGSAQRTHRKAAPAPARAGAQLKTLFRNVLLDGFMAASLSLLTYHGPRLSSIRHPAPAGGALARTARLAGSSGAADNRGLAADFPLLLALAKYLNGVNINAV